MNWDDPAERLRLIERVGASRYNAMLLEHQRATVVDTVDGHPIRPVNTRFGRLYLVGSTGRAFATLAEARAFAHDNPVA